MPKNLTDDPNSFDAEITVPVDSDARNAASVETPFQQLANRTAFVGKYVQSDEWTYPAPKERTLVLGASEFSVISGTWGGLPMIYSGRSNGADIAMQISGLPSGAEITKVEFMIRPGASRATVGNRVTCDIAVYDPYDFSTLDTPAVPTYSDSATDDGTSNVQVVTIAPDSPIAIDREAGSRVYLYVSAGSDAGTNFDAVYAVRLSYNDPGPRNF